jgi:hypothetical protein
MATAAASGNLGLYGCYDRSFFPEESVCHPFLPLSCFMVHESHEHRLNNLPMYTDSKGLLPARKTLEGLLGLTGGKS